jgi:hypothetical protein
MSVVGWLGSETREAEDFSVVAFREGLKEGGYSEGQNVGRTIQNTGPILPVCATHERFATISFPHSLAPVQ